MNNKLIFKISNDDTQIDRTGFNEVDWGKLNSPNVRHNRPAIFIENDNDDHNDFITLLTC